MPTTWIEVFKPDSGMVFEIRVYGITARDYDVLLPLLIQRYATVYSEDGETRDLPNYRTITRHCDMDTTTLEVNIVGVQVMCWFAEDYEVVLVLVPVDLDYEEKADVIFPLMS